MIPAPKYVGQSGTCDEMLHLRLFTMSSVHKSAGLNMPKWLTFTSIFIRLPAHFSNKCISISKHEHSMVIHIASLMRVNLHNTGKYHHKHIQLLANNEVTAPTRQKWKWVIRHQPRHQWSAIFINVWGRGSLRVHCFGYIYKMYLLFKLDERMRRRPHPGFWDHRQSLVETHLLSPASAVVQYGKSAYVNVRSGINRYLRAPPFNRKINLTKDDNYIPEIWKFRWYYGFGCAVVSAVSAAAAARQRLYRP